jgi:hypothetical protein
MGVSREILRPVVGDVTVENSDLTFQENVPAGDTLVLCDIEYEFLDEDDNVITTTERPAQSNQLIEIDIPLANVRNSNNTYNDTVQSGGVLVLPDTDINITVNSVAQPTVTIPTLSNETINITWL